MTALAALPMYDVPELTADHDALWAAIAVRLEAGGMTSVPSGLTRDLSLEDLWTDPDLLLAQTCGYPLMTTLAGRVSVVATPRYGAEGCDGATHRSAIVVRKGDRASTLSDLRGRICAVNAWESNSGMNLLRHAIAPLAQDGAFFSAVRLTGAHAASLSAVALGAADVAAIDGVTWAYLQRLRPEATAALRVLDWTAASPALPLITAASAEPDRVDALRTALDDVGRDPALSGVRQRLLLDGFSAASPADYGCVLEFEQAAIAMGYPALG